MMDPRSVTPGSIMPNYPWLYKNKVKFKQLTKKLAVLSALGAPYTDQQIDQAAIEAKAQADKVMRSLMGDGVPANMVDKEIIALIAYLQRLGTDMGGSDEITSVE
jgi:cytochrome c oxidase cbb3-type subunit I/II